MRLNMTTFPQLRQCHSNGDFLQRAAQRNDRCVFAELGCTVLRTQCEERALERSANH
jgi:hypothetical protein